MNLFPGSRVAEKYDNGKWSSIEKLPNAILQGCAFFHSSNDDIIYISGKDISLFSMVFFTFPAKESKREWLNLDR